MEKTAKPKRQKPDWAKQRDQRRKGSKQRDKAIKSLPPVVDKAFMARINVPVPMKERKQEFTGPPHLWPSEFHNGPMFRTFKGDSKSKARKKA